MKTRTADLSAAARSAHMTDPHEFWDLRDATPAEIEAFLDSVPDEELAPEVIERIIQFVRSMMPREA